MSASREVVAKANGVSTDECSCRNCANGRQFFNSLYICNVCGSGTSANDYCSFFEPREEGDNDATD